MTATLFFRTLPNTSLLSYQGLTSNSLYQTKLELVVRSIVALVTGNFISEF